MLSKPIITRSALVVGFAVAYALGRKTLPEWVWPISLCVAVVGLWLQSRRREQWIEFRETLRGIAPSRAPQGRIPIGPVKLALVGVIPVLLYVLMLFVLGAGTKAGDHTITDRLVVFTLPLGVLVALSMLVFKNLAEAAPTRRDVAALATEIEVQEELRRLRLESEGIDSPAPDRQRDAADTARAVATLGPGLKIAEDIVDTLDDLAFELDQTRSLGEFD